MQISHHVLSRFSPLGLDRDD